MQLSKVIKRLQEYLQQMGDQKCTIKETREGMGDWVSMEWTISIDDEVKS